MEAHLHVALETLQEGEHLIGPRRACGVCVCMRECVLMGEVVYSRFISIYTFM